MSDLETLIRVRRHDIEQQQKGLAVMYKKADTLRETRDSYIAELAIETEKAQDLDVDLLVYFLPYKKLMEAKITHIEAEQDKLEHLIRQAQDIMRDMFAEMKKIEIIDERRKAEILNELAKKEEEMLSDIALDRYRRHSD